MRSPFRSFRVLRFVALALFAALASAALVAAAPEAAIRQTDVFVAGQEGYNTWRIPAVMWAKNGDLLAFCEGRKTGGGDTGDIDLVMKRSTDGGQTWSAVQVIWDDAANTCGNPCPVLDAATGTISLLLTHNLGSDHEKDIAARTSQGTRTVWVARSADDGATWTKPVEITAATKDPSWTWYATGPGVGIQLQAGPHAGRLVIPCDHNADDPANPKRHISASHIIYSDDHGATWQLGGTIPPRVNECQVVELFDGCGTLLMNLRSGFGHNLRAQSTSTDSGATWSVPVDAPGLIEPVCQASILRHGDHEILFSNPAAEKTRTNLLVRASGDDGKTWRDVAALHPGPAAYSCLVSLSATEAGCLYECGEKKAYEKIVFARFTTR